MAKIRKKIIEFPNSVPTTGSAFLYAKKNPNDSYTTSNVTLEQMVTLLNGLLTFPGGGGGVSSVLYTQVFFVDVEYGDDLTAQYGNFVKPYSSINAAITAANLVGYNAASRALIYVRRGEYYGNNTLRNYVDLYFEPNTTVMGEFNDTAGGADSRIYGYARFRGSRALNLLNESNVHFEFDNAEVNGSFMITAPSTFLNLYVKGNYIKANAVGTGYGSTLRGNSNVNFNLTQYATCIHTFFDIRNSYSGKLTINIPEIHLAAGNLYGVDYKQCIYVRSSANATIKVNAKLINDTHGFSNLYGLCTIAGSTNLNFELNGDIDGLDGRGITTTLTDTTSYFKYTGNITTQNGAIYVRGSGNNKIENCNIRQTTDTVNSPILLQNTTALMLNNVTIINDSLSCNMIQSLNDTTKLLCFNTLAYNTASTGRFLSGITSWHVYMKNVTSNLNLDGTVIDDATPTGFVNDVNLTLI